MYAIVDIETTGLGGKHNKITEISIFKHDGQTIIEEFTSLVNPETNIPYHISGLTGITNDMVRQAPKFYEIAKQVIEMTQDCIFVAHSVNFDFNVIKFELEELGAEFKRKKLCTVRLSRKLIPGLRSYSLGNLCGHLGIAINGRHRARDDAAATVILFEKLLNLDQDLTVFNNFLNAKSRQATLPPLLPKSTVDQLPQDTGIYYFKDLNGQIIYVGKALNIKQRVLSHLYSKNNKELRLCRETADIDFTITGSELVALLLESEEIKNHYPKFNRAQKRNTFSYGIGTYVDRNGVVHIIYNRLKTLKNPLFKFYSQQQCRNFLEALCETHKLCPKYCSLQQTTGACFHYHIKSCQGICRDEELVEAYNQRVYQALATANLNQESFVIKDAGRHTEETAVVWVEKGIYKGFGYISSNDWQDHTQNITEYIEVKQDNSDVQSIIKSYLKQIDQSQLMYLE